MRRAGERNRLTGGQPIHHPAITEPIVAGTMHLTEEGGRDGALRRPRRPSSVAGTEEGGRSAAQSLWETVRFMKFVPPALRAGTPPRGVPAKFFVVICHLHNPYYC